MWKYILRLVLQRLLLLVLISIISHTIIHLAPGEPTEVDAMNPMMKAEDVAKIRAAFHLNDPIYLQYLHWIRDLFTGELRSFRDSQPVLPKIWARFGNSLLYVSNGTGYWGPPMRLGSPAEITQLVLEARPPAAAAAVP